MSTRCSCGRSKYFDADCCETCWNKGRAYDERSSNDPNYCQCGNPKISDACLCDDCWNKQSAYGDR